MFNKKKYYMAPEVELVEVKAEGNILNTSDPAKVSGTTVQGVTFDTEADW